MNWVISLRKANFLIRRNCIGTIDGAGETTWEINETLSTMYGEKAFPDSADPCKFRVKFAESLLVF